MGLDSPLTVLRGIGPARAEGLAEHDLHTIIDLLALLPTRYEDRRRRTAVAEIDEAGPALFEGRLQDLKRIRVRRRNLSLVRGWLEDDSGRLAVLWFNQPYLLSRLVDNEIYSLYGSVRAREGGWELINPSCTLVDERIPAPAVVPVYRPLPGIGAGTVRKLIAQAIDRGALEDLNDPMPRRLRLRHSLPTLAEALTTLHRPPDDSDLRALEERRTPAHARLSYGEFLELQLELSFLRGLEIERPKEHSFRIDDELHRVQRDLLPFQLTSAQHAALGEILHDLGQSSPMLRLLQGDVGCGKTIVAVLALVAAMESGLQGAFMAPTELLAEQHARNIAAILGERYRLALLTGSQSDREQVRRQVADGTIQVLVGTHALIQEGVNFARLGLAVVDEQHRFGVAQRRLLQAKGSQPDLLVMTATPIPRSLALTVYGDLSISVIDELPPGRRPVSTRVVPSSKRSSVYRWLRTRLEAGAQAYVVFPLIDESERLAFESLAAMGEKVRRYLSGFETAIVHGRLDSVERQQIMQRFREGEVAVLLATTVIEVGVDVGNATIMVIESGERFGLSQLHQLRGRVGRGAEDSYCVVMHGRLSAAARRRLEVLAATEDGFRIAEADLEIRGPGDLLGTRQSGLPWFRLADIVRDRRWLERARQDARELVLQDVDAETEGFLRPLRQRARSRYATFAGG